MLAILEKEPTESWENVAKGLGISRWQLLDLRRERSVQEAAQDLARELIRSEIPDVLKALATKAKSGDIRAVQLFLQYTGELDAAQREVESRDESITLEELEEALGGMKAGKTREN